MPHARRTILFIFFSSLIFCYFTQLSLVKMLKLTKVMWWQKKIKTLVSAREQQKSKIIAKLDLRFFYFFNSFSCDCTCGSVGTFNLVIIFNINTPLSPPLLGYCFPLRKKTSKYLFANYLVELGLCHQNHNQIPILIGNNSSKQGQHIDPPGVHHFLVTMITWQWISHHHCNLQYQIISVSLDNVLTPLVCITSGLLQQKFGPLRVLMFRWWGEWWWCYWWSSWWQLM